MRYLTTALLCLPLFAFGQDSLNVTRIGNIELTGHLNVTKPCYLDGYIYAPETFVGLHVVDVLNHSQPSETDMIEIVDWLGMATSFENYLYVAGGGDMRLFDIHNPAHPSEIDLTEEYAGEVRVFGSYLYMFNEELRIYDLSTPTAPELIGTYDAQGDSNSLWDIEIAGNYAYVSSNSGIRILDISNLSAPTEVGVYNTSSSKSLALSGNTLFATDFGDSLEIIDVTIPSEPVLITEIMDTDFGCDDVAIIGDYLLTLDIVRGLSVYNIAEVNSPQLVGWHSLSGTFLWYGSILAHDNNIVFVNYANGIDVFDISAALNTPENPNTNLPTQFSLHPIYPNPFNNTANITFDLPREVTGRLVVYDVLGRMANTLFDGKFAAGSHSMQFNGNNLSSGAYFIKLETPTYNATQKAILLK